jgi:uncharacterized protein
MNLSTLRQHRAQILAIADQYGAENVRVFGSVARGEETEKSDVDLLARIRRGTGIFKLVELQRVLGEMLGKDVQILSEKGLHPLLKDSILREAVPL